jgi:peptidoglycan/LPS O-acetylase OafA/YrhL
VALIDRTRWDLDALRAGGMVALVFAVPLSIGATWAADREDGALAVWLTLGAVLGFVLGAGCAAWVQRRELPLTHGLATAIGTYTIAQAVFIVVKLLRGGDVNWFADLFNLSVVAGAGLLGGLLGKRLRDRGFRPSGMEGTS